MKIAIKKFSKDAVIPTYSKEGDAGLDLTAVKETIIENKDYGYVEFDTDIGVEIPLGYVGLVFPRSSISTTGMLLSNSVGVIDSSYRGSIKLRFKYIKDSNKYKVGDRIAQLIIIPYPKIEFEEVEELSTSERGEAGFGSTNENYEKESRH